MGNDEFTLAVSLADAGGGGGRGGGVEAFKAMAPPNPLSGLFVPPPKRFEPALVNRK